MTYVLTNSDHMRECQTGNFRENSRWQAEYERVQRQRTKTISEFYFLASQSVLSLQKSTENSPKIRKNLKNLFFKIFGSKIFFLLNVKYLCWVIILYFFVAALTQLLLHVTMPHKQSQKCLRLCRKTKIEQNTLSYNSLAARIKIL